MAYFAGFPKVPYYFGDEKTPNLVQNFTAYVDVIDKLKEADGLYLKRNIVEGERPDVLSHHLYKDHRYYWTFYLMNDNIRRQGWPLTNNELLKKAKELYPNTTLVIRTILNDTFKVGTTIQGMTSGVSGEIIRRDLDLGQLIIKGTKNFIDGELIRYTKEDGSIESIALESSAEEYLSAHHYELNNRQVDFDPSVGPGVLLEEVTYLDRLNEQNENLKSIKVIKPERIKYVETIYRKSIQVR